MPSEQKPDYSGLGRLIPKMPLTTNVDSEDIDAGVEVPDHPGPHDQMAPKATSDEPDDDDDDEEDDLLDVVEDIELAVVEFDNAQSVKQRWTALRAFMSDTALALRVVDDEIADQGRLKLSLDEVRLLRDCITLSVMELKLLGDDKEAPLRAAMATMQPATQELFARILKRQQELLPEAIGLVMTIAAKGGFVTALVREGEDPFAVHEHEVDEQEESATAS